MNNDIDKLRESELTDHLKKEEQELSLVDHLREVTEEKKELERQLAEARKALEVVYDPICDMTFVIENEIKNMGVLTPVAKSMLIDASGKIMQGAKESEWFKKQLKEKGDE